MADSKKMTKGTVAIAAGVVLLLGGAGTYALWEVSESIDGNVQTGDLDLVLGSTSWALNDTPVDEEDIEDVRIVPGDVLTLAQALTVTAIGDTLQAELTIDEGNFIPAELDDYLTVDLEVSGLGVEQDGSYVVEAADDPQQATATVTVAFSPQTPNQIATGTNLNLDELEFTLAQVNGDD